MQIYSTYGMYMYMNNVHVQAVVCIYMYTVSQEIFVSAIFRKYINLYVKYNSNFTIKSHNMRYTFYGCLHLLFSWWSKNIIYILADNWNPAIPQ